MNTNYVSDVTQILSKIGEKPIDAEYQTYISEWANWYSKKTDDFYRYSVYNGFKKVECKRFSLCLPKLASQEWASLLFNDKTSIQVDSAKNIDSENGIILNDNQKKLDSILEYNLFNEKFTGLIEKTFAMGTGATAVYKDANGQPKINYIIAPMIFPLRMDNGDIVDVAFVSVVNDEYYFNIHKLVKGRYEITNRFFKYVDRDLVEVYHDEISDMVSDVKLFQIYKPAIENNIDLFTAYGLSVYGNSMDAIMACDSAYDSFRNEFFLGKKRIFLKTDVLTYKTTTDANGNTINLPIFDENQTEFYSYDTEDGDAIHEINPELRVTEHIDGLQTLLNIFGNSVGFGNDHYSFKDGKVYTNTSNLISSQSQLYKNLVKHEKVLRRGISELVKSLLYIADGRVFDGDVTIDFDDSIIEDTSETKRQAMLELNAGIIDKVEYLVQVYNMSEEQAAAFVKKIESRNPVEEEPSLE